VREKYGWLVAGGWFVLREKHCWLVADKPNKQGDDGQAARLYAGNICCEPHAHAGRQCLTFARSKLEESESWKVKRRGK
jgi:hypothetical protein